MVGPRSRGPSTLSGMALVRIEANDKAAATGRSTRSGRTRRGHVTVPRAGPKDAVRAQRRFLKLVPSAFLLRSMRSSRRAFSRSIALRLV